MSIRISVAVSAILANALLLCSNLLAQHENLLPATTKIAFSVKKPTDFVAGPIAIQLKEQFETTRFDRLVSDVPDASVLSILMRCFIAEGSGNGDVDRLTFAIVSDKPIRSLAIVEGTRIEAIEKTICKQLDSLNFSLVKESIPNIREFIILSSRKEQNSSIFLSRNKNKLLIASSKTTFAEFHQPSQSKNTLANEVQFQRSVANSSGTWFYLRTDGSFFSNSKFANDIFRTTSVRMRAVGGIFKSDVYTNNQPFLTISAPFVGRWDGSLSVFDSAQDHGPREFPQLSRVGNSVATLYLNHSNWIDSAGTIFDATIGEGEVGLFEAVVEDWKNEQGGPGVDVEKDIIENFVGELNFVSQSDGKDQSVGLFYRVKNPSVVHQAIERFFSDDPDVEMVGESNRIWKIKPSTRPSRGETRPSYLAVQNQKILFATQLDLVEKMAGCKSGPLPKSIAKLSQSIRPEILFRANLESALNRLYPRLIKNIFQPHQKTSSNNDLRNWSLPTKLSFSGENTIWIFGRKESDRFDFSFFNP